MEYLPYAALAVVALVIWDSVRRYFAHQAETRKFEASKASELLVQISQLAETQRIAAEKHESATARNDAALKTFLTSLQETVGFVQKERNNAQAKVLAGHMSGR